MDQDDNWRNNSPGNNYRGSPRHWNTRGYRGHSPRYRGGGSGGGWQQQSPYGYRPNSPSFRPPPFASTPYRQQRSRPNYSAGGRGGGRFNNSRGFHDEQGIEAWISPAMWEDPWKELMQQQDPFFSTTKFASESSDISVDQTSPSLNVSDMIMRSASESGLEAQTSSDPLPDISLELQQRPSDSVKTTEQKTEQKEEETQDAKNLLSLISS